MPPPLPPSGARGVRGVRGVRAEGNGLWWRAVGLSLSSTVSEARRFLALSSGIFAVESADRSTVAARSSELISWNLLGYYVLSRAVGQPDSDSVRDKYTYTV